MANAVRCIAPLLLAVIAVSWPWAAPMAGADPFPPVTGGQSASDTIDELQAQGFNVQINWLTGFDTKPLSQCRVTDIDNPGHSAPSEGSFTTVYVDVACPNGDDGGFTFGGGIG